MVYTVRRESAHIPFRSGNEEEVIRHLKTLGVRNLDVKKDLKMIRAISVGAEREFTGVNGCRVIVSAA